MLYFYFTALLYNKQVLNQDNPKNNSDKLSDNFVDLAEQLRSAIGDFVREMRMHDTLPSNQAAALGYLDRDGPLSIAEIARRQQVRHQSTARTVKLLKDQELVEFGQDMTDRRQVVVCITQRGRILLNQQRIVRAGAIAAAIEHHLNSHEQSVVAEIPKVLLKLVKNCQEKTSGAP